MMGFQISRSNTKRQNDAMNNECLNIMGNTSADQMASNRIGKCSSRIDELDAIRGFGALLVVLYHLWPNTFFMGWTRVDLFFVISGYLITSMILERDFTARALISFWARRAIRTWPAYYLLVAIICVRGQIWKDAPQATSVFAHLTFTQNLSYYWSGDGSPRMSGAEQTWSLAIEEQFYLVWPLVLAAIGRKHMTPICLWIAINSVASRLMGLYPAVIISRCDGLVIGAILANILAGEALKQRSKGTQMAFAMTGSVATFLLVCICPLLQIDGRDGGVSGCGSISILSVNILFASIVGMIVACRGHTLLKPLRIKVICYIGRSSYGIYLYHLVVFDAVFSMANERNFTVELTAVFLSILAGVVSHEAIEKPFCRLKKYIPRG